MFLDIIECESEIKPSTNQEELQIPTTDFLIPVHIRQGDNSLKNGSVPSLKPWKLINDSDDLTVNHSQDFYRMCPTTNSNESNSATVQVNNRLFPFSFHSNMISLSLFVSHRMNVK